MSKLQIEVKASYPSGAVLHLTEVQKNKVASFVQELVTGEPAVRPYKKSTEPRKAPITNHYHWSKTELDELRLLVQKWNHLPLQTRSADRARDLKNYRKDHARHRTMNSVMSRFSKMKKEYNKGIGRIPVRSLLVDHTDFIAK